MVPNFYLETTINKKRAGYVLIELLMVAAIITLITGGIMSQGVKWIDSIRLRQSSRELTSTLRLLQNRAITEERTIYFRFVLRENKRWGYIVKQTDEYGYFEPGEIYRPLPPGVKLDYFSAGLPELMLHATGAPSTGTTIRLSNSWGRSVEITILPATGRIQVKKETAN